MNIYSNKISKQLKIRKGNYKQNNNNKKNGFLLFILDYFTTFVHNSNILVTALSHRQFLYKALVFTKCMIHNHLYVEKKQFSPMEWWKIHTASESN